MTVILLFQLFICFCLLLLLLLFPQIAHQGADVGLSLFLEALFPYLLTYLILVNWLLKLAAAYPLKGRLVYIKIYVLSALGGFPTGASIITQLVKHGELTNKEAQLLLGVCHAPSPLFIIGFVGYDLLNAPVFSYQYLLLLHSFSLILLFLLPLKPRSLQPIFHEASFTNSLRESIPVVLIVGSTVIFFSTICAVIVAITEPFATSSLLQFTIAGLEITNGLHAISQLFSGDTLRLLMVILLTSQSLSIHLQVVILAKEQRFSLRPYFFIRLLYTVVIPILFALFFL